ncbi:unnamed protein product [Meganyctiphanes norvegica]|uniref:PH domain-containing protein n=1 Tax=Meganyctiphanes norvegica TaxID=48144 RepID=A0AAV2PP26_MEGNR
MSTKNKTHRKSMTALHLAAEGRDYLMWCPDLEFDAAVNALDMRGLVELVQTLQDAMAVEQQTFDSLSQQLEMISDPLQQQRLSAALCTSQTRLARLCSRNMRCFTQQALKARQKDGGESRSSSPRDSGVAGSYASDAEDPRSPGVQAHTFKNSLAFFQKAAHTANAKTTSSSRRHEGRRRSSRGSSSYSSSSEAWSVSSEDHLLDDPRLLPEDDLPDQGHYEQVLFINGRPQYQSELRSSSEQLDVRRNDRVRHRSVEETSRSTRNSSPSSERSRSWSRSRVDGSGGGGGGGGWGGGAAGALGQSAGDSSVTAGSPSRRGDSTDDSLESSSVTLPRRKPYLNFRSVSGSAINHSGTGSDLDNDDLRFIKDKNGISRSSNSVNTITRTQSFKEGLNCDSNSEFNSSISSNKVCGLSRTQSFHDGLSSDFNEVESAKPKLKRVPSVDEILESVKSLRAKKNMVKSTPDLLNAGEPVYSSASLPRHHKGSKGKAPRPPGQASLLGVRYTNTDPHYERVPDPHYEQIHEHTIPYYENLNKNNGNHYENVQVQGEVIYDSPRPTEHHYDKVHNDLHYENLKFDAPVYENINENEPTYMNVNGTKISKGNVYANLEPNNQKTSSIKSNKKSSSREQQQQNQTKITITGNSTVQGMTYDVPRAATHIYDSPQKQVRSVVQQASSEYDTPKNNRSILPQSTQIVLNAKPITPVKTSSSSSLSKTQKDTKKLQKIDDIFAECDRDSLGGDVREREPDIPSPDYGSEEESEGYTAAHNGDYHQNNQDFPDEGLGESDARSFYTEDQGLEVILEEPEEEYCSSHVSEDDLRCEIDISHELKGERRSLDGSEGIGSAEGDTHSSGGSEHYAEEDCASSGIHSEDTPSPAPTEQDALEETTRREEDRTQKDRCLEVYPETLRQRQRAMIQANNKVDIKNWSSSGGDLQQTPNKSNKKFLPSVKALRNQFESGKSNNNRADASPSPTNNSSVPALSRRSSTSNSSLASSSLEKASSTNSLNSQGGSSENLLGPSIENGSPRENGNHHYDEEPVEPIFNQFKQVDEELRQLMKRPPTTVGWNPRSLLRRLYYVPDAPKIQSRGTTYVNIEGYLEKLPSGRKKATFWNAWKRRYFVAKDGVLYYYQNNQSEKPSMKMSLMGGKVECMEPSMIGVDDGKGHYVVVRCSTRQEAERWRRALETHNVEDFASQYVQPWPIPTNPTLLRDTLVVDLGSASVRAGVLASNPTLPQLFFPSVVSTARGSKQQTWGFDSLSPDIRANSNISFPLRPSHKISKYSVDLSTVSSLLQKTFAELSVDPKNYHLQIAVPRILNTQTQAELLRILFEKFDVKSVNLTHQSILALYAYNATSGIVVDIGERMDIVPVIDGYIVDGGVSRVPYGGHRIIDHLRQFLYQNNVSLVNEVESYIIRYVLENSCYCAHHYNTEKARCTNNSENFEKNVSLSEFFQGQPCPYANVNVDFGRFQATEGLFNPDAWGLDHPGLHKLVHKAIQECSMDIRKEMSRSIFLSGGVSQLPGLTDRLTTELDNLTPPAIRPKVHSSPYSYHAAYLGGCVLAESPAFVQSRITREDWNKHGNMALRKWSL